MSFKALLPRPPSKPILVEGHSANLLGQFLPHAITKLDPKSLFLDNNSVIWWTYKTGWYFNGMYKFTFVSRQLIPMD
jgi:hypothetical protein